MRRIFKSVAFVRATAATIWKAAESWNLQSSAAVHRSFTPEACSPLMRRCFALGAGPELQIASVLWQNCRAYATVGGVRENPVAAGSSISVTFGNKDGQANTIKVPVGMSMLEAAHENDIELEGACEGSLACSTCHVILMDEEYYNKLPEPCDEENDMLDLAFGLTETSRLGCQVIAKPELNGMRLRLPSATRNFAVDGHVPKPH